VRNARQKIIRHTDNSLPIPGFFSCRLLLFT
jgi:hypothetical protein